MQSWPCMVTMSTCFLHPLMFVSLNVAKRGWGLSFTRHTVGVWDVKLIGISFRPSVQTSNPFKPFHGFYTRFQITDISRVRHSDNNVQRLVFGTTGINFWRNIGQDSADKSQPVSRTFIHRSAGSGLCCLLGLLCSSSVTQLYMYIDFMSWDWSFPPNNAIVHVSAVDPHRSVTFCMDGCNDKEDRHLGVIRGLVGICLRIQPRDKLE